MSNTQWFYADAQQQQLGPVTFEQIQQLATSGQIQPTSLIWNEGMPNWTAANQVKGVFNPASATTPPNNPYAAPNGDNLAPSSIAGSYPIPPVKKVSIPLYLITYIVGILLIIGGIAMIGFNTALEASESSQIDHPIETAEDLREYQSILDEEESTIDPLDGNIGPIALTGVGSLIALFGWILSFVILYRAWVVLQNGRARTTPGKAVGFMFIPLFNLYWIFVSFYGWAQDWNRIQSSHTNLSHIPPVTPGLFLGGAIFSAAGIIPVIGVFFTLASIVINIIMTFKMAKVVNQLAISPQN